MKKCEWTMVAIGLIGAALVLGIYGEAQAASFHQTWQFGQVRGSFGAGKNDDEMWANVNIDTLWSVEAVSADFYPSYWDPSEFMWSVGVSGRRDRNDSSTLSASTDIYSPVRLWQVTGIDWSVWQDRSLHNNAYASLNISPAKFLSASSYYNEWDMGVGSEEGPWVVEKWWNAQFSFRGSFGDGPTGDKIGAEFFGITNVPEPATMALLGLGGAMFYRKRRQTV